jgi:hypothetical protein
MNRLTLIGCRVLGIGGLLYAQEALKSVGVECYDFLALPGIMERPTLNYRTLSDSAWTIPTGAYVGGSKE